MNYWLVKSEPSAYSWQTFVREGKGRWDGVRNFQARNNLRKMKLGDRVLFYHSVEGQAVVGIAEVTREAYPDPTTKKGGWLAVDLKPVSALKKPVKLSTIKLDKKLQDVPLVRQGRLSVMPLSEFEFNRIVEFGSD